MGLSPFYKTMSSFKVICPFCKKENDFNGDNWCDDLVDDTDTSEIECMHCDYPMDITTTAVYSLSVAPLDLEHLESGQEY